MGFLINDLQIGPKAEKGVSKETLNRMGCKLCPLNNADVESPKMEPSGSDAPLIYILAEAPGADEDKKGEPLVGASGQLLKKTLAQAIAEVFDEPVGSSRHDKIDKYVKEFCRFNNVVRDRPPKNRTPEYHEIEACRGYLEKDIAEAKPFIVIGCGTIPLNWMIGVNGILNWRSIPTPMEIRGHRFLFFPTIHPSYVLRNKKKVKYGKSQEENIFYRDFKKAVTLAKEFLEEQRSLSASGIELPISKKRGEELLDTTVCIDGSNLGDLSQVQGMLLSLSESEAVAFDIETSSKRQNKRDSIRPYDPEPRILSIALSDGKTTLSVAIDHPEAKWKEEDRKELLESIIDFLLNGQQNIAHNLSYELEWLVSLWGERVVREGVWGDTMAQAYILGHRPGTMSLNALTKSRMGLSLKELSGVDSSNLIDVPVGKVLKYNGGDALFTYLLFREQEKDLRSMPGQWEVYLEQVRRIPTLVFSQVKGLIVDQDKVEDHRATVLKVLDEIMEDLKETDGVKQFRSMHGSFNPGSDTDCGKLFRDILKRPEGYRGENKYSTDKDVLKKIPLIEAELLIEWRENNKLLTTYIEPYTMQGRNVWPDGKIHTVFNHSFVATRRLSSSSPNVQNQPKRSSSWIRAQIVPPKGFLMASIDYGQIEARVVAMFSKDKNLVKYLWDRYDIHQAWAERIAEEYPKALDWAAKITSKLTPMKSLRQETKNKFVFPALYGSGASSIADDLNMPLSITSELLEEFWDEFKGVKKWQQEIRKKYIEEGYVELMTGYRIYEPVDKMNAIINYGIQGTASDIVVDGMNRLSEKSWSEDLPHLQSVVNIHDDLTFYFPEKEADLYLDHAVREMLACPFDWINVPLAAEASVGKDWYNMEEIDTFWSDQLD